MNEDEQVKIIKEKIFTEKEMKKALKNLKVKLML